MNKGWEGSGGGELLSSNAQGTFFFLILWSMSLWCIEVNCSSGLKVFTRIRKERPGFCSSLEAQDLHLKARMKVAVFCVISTFRILGM